MSAETLKLAAVMAANADTPANVAVPQSLAGVIAWMVGRLGPTVALAVTVMFYFGWDRNKMFDQYQSLNKTLLEAYTARTAVDTEHNRLLSTMQDTLRSIDRNIQDRKNAAP